MVLTATRHRVVAAPPTLPTGEEQHTALAFQRLDFLCKLSDKQGFVRRVAFPTVGKGRDRGRFGLGRYFTFTSTFALSPAFKISFTCATLSKSIFTGTRWVTLM